MTPRMTKTKALRQALEEHGSVARYVPGPHGYAYSVWSEKHQAWWQPSSTGSYDEARARRSRSIYERAAELMFGLDAYGMQPFCADDGSDVRAQFDAFVKQERLQ